LAMCRRLVHIEFPRRYAVAALTGKLQEWYRAHPGVEVPLELEESERIKGPRPDAMTSADLSILFAEIKVQLSERDRQILVLMEQDLGSPQQIAEVFEMSYSAAAKAIQRVRDRMAAILAPSETRNGSDNEMMTRSRHFNPDI
jgi:DNA-directed RNA polymerase specialized sigma24 family protein